MSESFFYAQACSRRPHYLTITLMTALITVLFIPQLGAEHLDMILLSVLIGLLVMDWVSSIRMGGPICTSFPTVNLRLLFAYGVMTSLLSMGMILASGWLFMSTLNRIFDESKSSVVIRAVRCSVALILFTSVFVSSIIPPLLDNDMGAVSSIHRIMYEINRTPASKDKMLEHLLCSRIPIYSHKGINYITPTATNVILDTKYNHFIPAATIIEYNNWIKDKKCPAGSEAGTNNPYPKMMDPLV